MSDPSGVSGVIGAGLTIYRSNRLEALLELLAWNIAGGPAERPADPMRPLRIVVGSGGMARWLEHRLAERWGIFAHVELPFPARALGAIVDALPSEASAAAPPTSGGGPDAWSPAALTWAILETLNDPRVTGDERFAPLGAYLEQDPHTGRAGPGGVTARGYGLARQIADVFDRYVTYRAEMACAWSEDAPADAWDAQAPAWQRPLWRALAERLDVPHAAQRASVAAARLDAAALDPAALTRPPLDQPLRIFGLSTLPPAWLDLAVRLSRRLRVDLYLLCPSHVYWADLSARRSELREWVRKDGLPDREALNDRLRKDGLNPLLQTCGRAMRDLQIRLENLPDQALQDRTDLFVDMARALRVVPDPEAFAFTLASPPASALGRLQSDVLHARPPAGQTTLDARDDSIALHACPGAMRQVEVLRDALLGLFVRHPHLQPRDVVVLCPAIESFAPLITAVFGHGARELPAGSADVPRIPFTIADLSFRRVNPVADALLRLLALTEARLTASGVLDLLALEAIRARFELSAEDLTDVRRWVVGSGIRWGADADDRAAEDQPADAQNTLGFGLDRLLLGVAMADADAPGSAARGSSSEGRGDSSEARGDSPGGVRPFDALDAQDALTLGRFADFVSALVSLRQTLRTPRPVADWVALLAGADGSTGVLEAFTDVPVAGAWLTHRVRAALDGLAAAAGPGQTRPVDVAALRATLDGAFDLPGDSGPRETGGVTFSSLVPMRGLPHRVVCLLGMDEGAFPRASARSGFDLISGAPRLGDRDPADEDRGALLEAIMATREHLLVLYSGRDERSNQPRPPAVPIGELRDLLDSTFAPPGGEDGAADFLTTTHPLQAFAAANFTASKPGEGLTPDGEPFSFDARLRLAAERARDTVRSRRPFFEPGEPLPPEPLGDDRHGEAPVLELTTLARFLRDPHDALLRRRFGVYPNRDVGEAVPDREPFDIEGGLTLWKVRQDLLAGLLEGRGSLRTEAALRAAGELPLGDAAEAALAQPRSLAHRLAEAIGALPPVDAEVEVRHRIGGRTLVGHVGGLRDGIDLAWRFGRDPGGSSVHHWLPTLWVRLLARQLAAPRGDAVGLVLHTFLDRGTVALTQRWLASPPNAQALLADLIALHAEGTDEPLPLLPNGSFALAWTLAFDKTLPTGWIDDASEADDLVERLREVAPAVLAKATQAVEKAWVTFNGGGDSVNPMVATLFGGTSPAFSGAGRGELSPRFVRCAWRLWGPILRARSVSKKRPGGTR